MQSKPDSCERCPLGCSPLGSLQGWVGASGDMNKGVLIVGDAAGTEEEIHGHPFVGKAGHYLWGNLKRIGLDRNDFRTTNVLSCRPPDNRLIKQSYEAAAIAHCRPNLDRVIEASQRQAKAAGQHFTILCLGQVAFKRVMQLDEYVHSKLLKLDYQCYPFWSEKYQAWVIAADHPTMLMRGNHHLLGILQFAATRAVEIATKGFAYADTKYLEDPDPIAFRQWVDEYIAALAANPTECFLSYDIETPMKQKEGNEEKVGKEEDNDYTILRIAFAHRPHEAASVRWATEYLPDIRRALASSGPKLGWNSNNYDDPRIMVQTPIEGDRLDGMLAWHVLNSALPKGLGFVTPFYAKRSGMWKHLAEAQPAFYNAKDADMALQNWLGIRADLKKGVLGEVFDRHVTQMNRVFNYMSSQGVLRDELLRDEAEAKLNTKLAELQAQIEAVIPQEARSWKVYKKTPKNLDGLVQIGGQIRTTKTCSICESIDVTASHVKSVGKKRLKAGEPENPCVGASIHKCSVSSTLWAQPLEFKLSTTSLKKYQSVVKHAPIFDPKEKRITYDDKAMQRLRKKYPKDQLYPLIGQFKKTQKLLGTYIGRRVDGKVSGGLAVGADSKIHCTFSHNPSTLRSACQNPNLQNLPRPSKDPDNPATLIRNLIVAAEGNTFLARDYSGIEAVLVGYFAKDPGYIRLAKKDVHSFYTAYGLHQLDGRISANDLPLLSWDDDKLFSRLADIKKEFGTDRNTLYKHLVHGANFWQGAKGATEKIFKETGIEHPVKTVQKVMDVYFELFPSIPQWHKDVLAQADHDGYLRNPFGYIHRFHRIYEWDNIDGQWQKERGPDANAAIAFGPQSTAAGIIKEAMMRCYFERFEEVGQYLRLLIHDEVFCEVPKGIVRLVDAALQSEMEKPIMCMPLLPEWGMGDYLTILTEEKIGERWGLMK